MAAILFRFPMVLDKMAAIRFDFQWFKTNGNHFDLNGTPLENRMPLENQ